MIDPLGEVEMLGYMLRKMLNLLTIAKVLNIIAFSLSLIIVFGGFITYDWSRMPYTGTNLVTVEGTITSLAVFAFIAFTIAFSFYVLRRLSKEQEAYLNRASEEIEASKIH